TDPSGTIDLGNGANGIEIFNSGSNFIGGSSPAERNVISGNHEDGIDVSSAVSTNNVILGNFIGTDATGTRDLGTDTAGIEARDTADTISGGPAAGAGNGISGNNGAGIFCQTASAATIQGNLIGLDVTGTVDLGNTAAGVGLFDTPDCLIGGVNPG